MKRSPTKLANWLATSIEVRGGVIQSLLILRKARNRSVVATSAVLRPDRDEAKGRENTFLAVGDRADLLSQANDRGGVARIHFFTEFEVGCRNTFQSFPC